MRTLLIALLTLTVSFTAQAHHRYKANSQFNIRMADLSNYTVVFNNTTYFATEWVKIYNVPPGKHYLRIEETMQTRGYGMRATGRRLIYDGWITVPAASKVVTRVSFSRNFMVARIDRMDCRKPYYGRGHYQDDDYGYQNGPVSQGRQYQDDDDDYSASDPNTYDYGTEQNPNYGGTYDDGTYGTSQLKAPKPTTQKATIKQNQQKTK